MVRLSIFLTRDWGCWLGYLSRCSNRWTIWRGSDFRFLNWSSREGIEILQLWNNWLGRRQSIGACFRYNFSGSRELRKFSRHLLIVYLLILFVSLQYNLIIRSDELYQPNLLLALLPMRESFELHLSLPWVYPRDGSLERQHMFLLADLPIKA